MIRRSRTRTLIVTRSQTITSTGSGAIEPLFFDSAKGSRHPATSGAAPLKRSPRGWQMWWAPRKARGPWRSDPALRAPPGIRRVAAAARADDAHGAVRAAPRSARPPPLKFRKLIPSWLDCSNAMRGQSRLEYDRAQTVRRSIAVRG
jgi:hypothetical protein